MTSSRQKALLAANLFDLTDQTALVTGASSGLGARFARVLAANGAKVALVARRKDRLETLAAKINETGGQALAIEADVANRSQMQNAFDAAEGQFGTISICVNNAGISKPVRLIDEEEQSAWRETMAINLDAAHDIGIMAAKRMQAAAVPGAIVNVASILGFGVGRGVGAYAVSKAAVIQLTKSMAFEFARFGVRVNALAPGYFATEINGDWLRGAGAAMAQQVPLRRFGAEGELDGALLLLAAPKAGGYITGAAFVVDGGHLIAIPGV